MAETLLSPGVLARETDQSFLTQAPVTAGAAIIGPTVLGPVEVPTLVTTYSDYLNRFGGSFLSGGQQYSFLTQISAYNYFQNGGTSLLVTRVASGSFTSATASIGNFFVTSSTTPLTNGATGFNSASGEFSFTSSFVISTIAEGDIMNSISGSDSAVVYGADSSNGSLASGSVDNLRWQITGRDTDTGTFSLLVRQGNDTTNDQNILETWANLSLDPLASNYISKVIGDQYRSFSSTDGAHVQTNGTFPNQSRYIYVSRVNKPTPNYFDNSGNPVAAYAAYLPVASSGSFGGAAGSIYTGTGKFYNNISSLDTQGLTGANYNNAISLMANQDDYVFNVISVPGLTIADNSSQITTLVNNVQSRGDAIVVADPRPYGDTVSEAVTSALTVNSSYAAAYWPWVMTLDPGTGQMVWVPASTMVPAVYAFNDSVSEPWFAPAGINRGGLETVIQAERKLTQSQRNTLYNGNVNPIATFPGTGVVIYGQKTLQKRASALDRVNVRRLLIALKSYISQVALNLVFEQNTIATRNAFLSQVNPYLESVQQRQGLYAFRVIMDDSNNTPDVIDRNMMVGQIYLQPTKTAEFIYLDFNILPTGATFPG